MDTKPTAKQADGLSNYGAEEGLAVLARIISGLLIYGGLGWLGDHYLHTSWMLPVGLCMGLALSIYLIYLRYGSVK